MKAEQIILTKKYFELSNSERESIKSLVTNEIEFDDLKLFLLQTKKHVKANKLTTTDNLDKLIFQKLNSVTLQPKQYWYNTLILFLFPRDTQFFKYPVFQLAIATIFLFGVFNIFNFTNDITESSSKVAMNKPDKNLTTKQKALKYEDQNVVLKPADETQIQNPHKQNKESESILKFESDFKNPEVVNTAPIYDLLEMDNVTDDKLLDEDNEDIEKIESELIEITNEISTNSESKVFLEGDKIEKLEIKKSNSRKDSRSKPKNKIVNQKHNNFVLESEDTNLEEIAIKTVKFSVKEMAELNKLFYVINN